MGLKARVLLGADSLWVTDFLKDPSISCAIRQESGQRDNRYLARFSPRVALGVL